MNKLLHIFKLLFEAKVLIKKIFCIDGLFEEFFQHQCKLFKAFDSILKLVLKKLFVCCRFRYQFFKFLIILSFHKLFVLICNLLILFFHLALIIGKRKSINMFVPLFEKFLILSFDLKINSFIKVMLRKSTLRGINSQLGSCE